MSSYPSPIATQSAQDTEREGHLASWYTPGLSDGLGDRLLMFDNTTASSLELLRFKREFGTAPGFETALRRRIDELGGFTHSALAKVRAVEWLGDGEDLALVSNHTVGRRLSEMLRDASGTRFAVELIRQLAPVLAVLQRQTGGIGHGAVTPERIVVTPDGRLILVEHVLGRALDSLRLPASRLRAQLGLAVPFGSTEGPLDSRSDVLQLGYVALSLLMGRHVHPTDDPQHVAELLEHLEELSRGRVLPPPHLRDWLEQALQVGDSTFDSAADANFALRGWPDDRKLELQPTRSLVEIPMPADSRNSLPAASAHEPDSEFDFLAESEVERLAKMPPKIEPISRGAAVFEHRPAKPLVPAPPVTAETVEPAKLPAKDPAALPSLDSALADLRSRVAASENRRPASRLSASARWGLIGLSVLSISEAVVIAGLLYLRPWSGSAAAAFSPPRVASPDQATSQPVAPKPNTPPPAAPAPVTQGRLEVSSDPQGAKVTVDGVAAGTTPISVFVGPGEHAVVIAGGGTTTRRTVSVNAGATSTLMASLGPAGATGGFLSVDTPLDLQVFEGSALLGTTKAARIMLPAGRHQLQLTNTALGFQQPLTVDIQAGKTLTTKVTIPNGTLSVNALPWANVWVDGQSLGTTPFANVSVPVGTHEVIWRHPQLGERRQSVVVTAKAPVRLVMDLTK
jgi:serine/threonine-protein kinase